jgi:hypothetical protein
LKELKIINSNEEGLKKVTVQCDQMLEGLKAKNRHAIQKVLKKHQSLIDGAFMSKISTLTFSYVELVSFTINLNAFLNFRTSLNEGENAMTKSQELQS